MKNKYDFSDSKPNPYLEPVKSNYENFDLVYQKLLREKSDGWGGDLLEIRKKGWAEILQKLTSHPLFPQAGARLLELGSGAGNISELFSKAGYQYTGIEISKTAVEWAQKRFEALGLKGDFFCNSATNLSLFKNDHFEVVIDGNLLHCIIGEDRKKVFNEVKRVLKKDGYFFVSTMVGDPKGKFVESGYFDSKSRCQIQNGIATRYMATPEELIKELIARGFKIEFQDIIEHEYWDHMSILVKK